jgi:anti-sigma regulatory factor (Ser/Thr protein kinase)
MTLSDAAPCALSALHDIESDMQISTLELHAQAMGRAQGLDEEALARLALVVSEIALNIVRHATVGHVILRPIGAPGAGCVEVLGLDKGPGIADMTRVMRGQYSTPAAPSPRESGLAGLRRHADLFDIHSQQNKGTAVVAHVASRSALLAPPHSPESVLRDGVGVVCVAARGEEESGDAWAVCVQENRLTALVVDGLGHGPEAAIPATAAMALFNCEGAKPPEMLAMLMHGALHATRGAALSMASIDEKSRTVRFCGVGNVEGRVVSVESNRHFIAQNGIVGHKMPPSVQPSALPWPVRARLVMHSDGISSQWSADQYPGLLARHPALLAGVLFRDFARPRDDVTVLVIRDPLPA